MRFRICLMLCQYCSSLNIFFNPKFHNCFNSVVYRTAMSNLVFMSFIRSSNIWSFMYSPPPPPLLVPSPSTIIKLAYGNNRPSGFSRNATRVASIEGRLFQQACIKLTTWPPPSWFDSSVIWSLIYSLVKIRVLPNNGIHRLFTALYFQVFSFDRWTRG